MIIIGHKKYITCKFLLNQTLAILSTKTKFKMSNGNHLATCMYPITSCCIFKYPHKAYFKMNYGFIHIQMNNEI